MKNLIDKLKAALDLLNDDRLDEAHAALQEILQSDPDNGVALFSMGVIAAYRGALDEALAHFERAAQLMPSHADSWYNRGTILHRLNRLEDAVASFDRTLELAPTHAGALVNRGVALREMNRVRDTLENFQRLLALTPDNENALNNTAVILSQLKRYDEAIELFEKLIALSPHHSYALGELCMAYLHNCLWDRLPVLRTQILEGLRAGRTIADPLVLMALTDSQDDQLRLARIFAADRFPPSAQQLWNGERYTHDKIRVAYMSPDFREHPVGHLVAGLFEHHDKSRFELIAISLGVNDESRLRQRMVAAFDEFIDAQRMSSLEVASLLRAKEVDILVDLAGYTQDARVDVLTLRPAPVQVSYLGYSGTLGSDYHDYIIADRHVIPPQLQDGYTENVVQLPDIYMPTDDQLQIADPLPRAAYGLPGQGFVFCSFNHDYKINPGMFDLWMRLLAQVDGSVLWLMKLHEAAERNLLREAEKRGIARERIVFATRVPRIEDHLARYRAADLCLDTFPYNAHSTSSDVLRAGLPLVTCRGQAFASRVAAALLSAVGLPELITDTLQDYEALALRLARDADLLGSLRAKLARNLATTPLYDTARYCRHLEAAYATMRQRSRNGQAPVDFAVPALQATGPIQAVASSVRATQGTSVGADLPHASLALLEAELRKTRCYLEFGMGGSTVLAARLGVPLTVSVDTSTERMDALREHITAQPTDSEVLLLHCDVGPVNDRGYPLDESQAAQWPSYYTGTWDTLLARQPEGPGLVMLNGRFRVACFLYSLLHLQPGATVLWNGYRSRHRYHMVEQFLKPAEFVDDMAVFRVTQRPDASAVARALFRSLYQAE